MLVVVVPKENAESLRRVLHSLGIVDRSVHMTKRDQSVLVPVTRKPPVDLSRYGAHLDDVPELVPRSGLHDPHAVLHARLTREGIPIEVAPTKWEKIGDVLVLRLSEAARPHTTGIARVYGETLGARTVVEDRSGIHGILRRPDVRILWGNGTETIHREGGVRYRLDVAEVMLSSGNVAERTSVASKVRSGSVVVDLFAGIGYFVLPIAVHARPEQIYACERNPVAFRYLNENIALNRVSNVTPLWGDCRKTAPRGIADVVIMGHFAARDYLDVAFGALRGAGLVIYHELGPREQFPRAPLERFTSVARTNWYDVESAESRIVKSYAPGIVHAVLEARVRRRPKDPSS